MASRSKPVDARWEPVPENRKPFNIKERLQIAYTRLIKRGMSTSDIAEAVGMTEDEVKIIFTYFDQLNRFEQKLNAL